MKDDAIFELKLGFIRIMVNLFYKLGLVAILLCLVPFAHAFVLDGGGGVYWQNTYGKITAYPATLQDLQNIQYINITSNITVTQNLDAAFEFNTSVIRPLKAEYWADNVPHVVPARVNITEQIYDPYSNQTVNWTHEINNGTTTIYYDDWLDISNKFDKKTYNGLTYYVIENVSFSLGQTRQLKVTVFANPQTSGKYGLRMKRSSDTWQDVINNVVPNVYLDPWFNSSFNLRFNITFACNSSTTSPNCDNNIAVPWFYNNATTINKMGVNGASVRYVTECGSGNFTQRPIWFEAWNAGVNFSAWLNYTNITAPSCTHWIYYNNSGASSVSSPWQVFDLYDAIDTTSTNTTMWTCYTSCPYLGGNGWAEFHYVGAQYGWYLASAIAQPVTMFAEIQERSTVGKSIFMGFEESSGNGYYSYYVKTALSAGPNVYLPRTTTNQPTGALSTTLDQTYLYRFTSNFNKYNISRMSTATDSLSGAGFTYIHEQMTANGNATGKMFVPFQSSESATNASMYWAGFTKGDDIPTISSYSTEEISAGAFADNVTLCNGTACSTLGTLYKGNPTALNASGNCSSLTVSPLTGYFKFNVNGTAIKNTITYNWIANQTNYTNASVSGAAINKSDTWQVGLICYDGSLNSTETMSTAYTVNNTAPTITAPSLSSNTYGFTNVSLITCNNGTYSDYEPDAMNVTGWYQWFLNGTVLAGQTAQTLNASNATVKANQTDRIICEWQAQDTGYNRKNASNGPLNASQVIINSYPVVNSVAWCEGGACTAITSIYGNSVLNCKANVTDNDNATIWSTRFMIYSNYAYINNKTVYGGANNTFILMGANSTLTGYPKGTNLTCGALASDLMGNSTQFNASIFLTVNNTAPTIASVAIASNESGNATYYNTSILYCYSGTYSDAVDGDANGSVYYRWWKNGALYAGATTYTLNMGVLANFTTGDIVNCSVKQVDSGYDMKNSTEIYSLGIIVGTVTPGIVSITNCTTGFKVLEFQLWDEENNASLNGTFEMTFTVWDENLTNSTNTSFIFVNQHNVSICINPYAAIVYVDSFQSYYSNLTLTDYPQRNYFLLKAKLNASLPPQVIPLYLENGTLAEAITIFLRDESGKGVAGSYISFSRYYPGTGEYRLVAMTKSNSEGYGATYLRPRDPYYRIIVYQENGTILQAFAPAFIPCDPGATYCTLSLQITAREYGYYWQYYGSIASNCSYSNSTGSPIIACVFLDTSGLTKNTTLLVTHLGRNVVQDCRNTTTATSATLMCWLPSLPNAEFQYSLTANINPGIVLQTGSVVIGRTVTFGTFGLFLSALIIFTLAFVGLSLGSPPIVIALATVGVIASSLMGLLVLSVSAIVGIAILAVLMIFLMRRS